MRVIFGVLGFVLLCASALGASASASASVPVAVPFDAKAAPPKDGSGGKRKSLSDNQIKTILITESIAAYQGNCPCPYSTARNGSRCGKRSAWSRAGGEEPLCYPDDVTTAMVQQYRDAHPEQ